MLQTYWTRLVFIYTVCLLGDGWDEGEVGPSYLVWPQWHLSLTVPRQYSHLSLNIFFLVFVRLLCFYVLVLCRLDGCWAIGTGGGTGARAPK